MRCAPVLNPLFRWIVGFAIAGLTWAGPLTRVPNSTLQLPEVPGGFGYRFVEAFPGLTLDNPVAIATPPGETNRLFIVEQRGRIIVVTNLALEKYALYRNEGDGRFSYASLTSGLAGLTARSSGWGVGIHDFDNDGNKDIFAALPKGDCDLATIYRSMHLLESMGMVKRFDFGDGVARFELVGQGEDGHHHHLICTRCTEVVEIEECFPHTLEEAIAVRNGFKSVSHKFNLTFMV